MDYSARAAPWVKEKCSAPGENCSETQCCKEPGMQCYTKLPGWASCKAECVSGPDPMDDNNWPWECKELGTRTPGAASSSGRVADWVSVKCSGEFENCIDARCCKEGGTQCYTKNRGWAMCMPRCTPGPLLTELDPTNWDCVALGGRTPGIPKATNRLPIADWVAERCSKSSENCNETLCCAEDAMQCYKKSDGWATCMRSCEVGDHPDDKVEGPWGCKKLGPRTPRPWGSPSLYCFAVIRAFSGEVDIMRQALELDGGAGIFACDEYDVFASDGETWLGDGPLGQIRTRHFDDAPVGISVDGTAADAALFMNVWAAVKLVGRYNLTDWTIKVDPEAVVLPDRLRSHLRGHTGGAAYIVDCNKAGLPGGGMMFRAVEAISHQALLEYFQHEESCRNNYQFGEDRWLADCLRKLGVDGERDFGMVGDDVCTSADCRDGKAAYHPFTDASSWKLCYEQAAR